jgi:hypothetical protein
MKGMISKHLLPSILTFPKVLRGKKQLLKPMPMFSIELDCSLKRRIHGPGGMAGFAQLVILISLWL